MFQGKINLFYSLLVSLYPQPRLFILRGPVFCRIDAFIGDSFTKIFFFSKFTLHWKYLGCNAAV